MSALLELGLDSFGDVTVGSDGKLISQSQALRNVVEQAVLADQLGIYFIGLGEHHRPDFAISAPETVLAAIAGQTKQIKLGTAVTVLSSDDPIRVFQRFSTLDALSNGRAEIILGRGSFTESFPLFGFPLDEYERLFDEKLDIFAKLLEHNRTGEPVSWQGTVRAPIQTVRVYPRTESGELKTWIGVGGSPQSVVRAARYRLPLMLAIIGGNPLRFSPYVELYRDTLKQLGATELSIGVHSPGHIADSDAQAREELWPAWREMRNRIGAERGWPHTSRPEFDAEADSGALFVGSPETVAQKIARVSLGLGLARFDLKYSNGTLAHETMMRSIELYGREVIPKVRAMLLSEARERVEVR